MKTSKFRFPLVLALSSLVASLFLATGCNTMQGAGKDIEKAGDKIQDAAQRNK